MFNKKRTRVLKCNFINENIKIYIWEVQKMMNLLNKKSNLEKELCGETKIFGESYSVVI